MDCPDVKRCQDCYHYESCPSDTWSYENKCGRLTKRVCDLVYGTLYYPNRSLLLNCESEREELLDLRERLFGERKDKCGKDGKYWEPKCSPLPPPRKKETD